MRNFHFVFLSFIVVVLGTSCTAPRPGAVQIDNQRCLVRCSGVVQRSDAPRMNDWGSATPALLGSKGGNFESHFVFLADAPVIEIHAALVKLGAKAQVVYRDAEVAKHKGYRKDTSSADYMQGDPMQISIEWMEEGRLRCRPYEEFFQERMVVGENTIEKPWTPHFVFHGSNVLNKRTTGCLACTHDCPGGIIGNNQFPLVEPIPVLKADWTRIPAPGTPITIVFRPAISR